MSCDVEETLISLDSSDEDVFYQLKKAHQGEFRLSLLPSDPLRRILPRVVTRFRRHRHNGHAIPPYDSPTAASRRLRRIFSLVKCLAISTASSSSSHFSSGLHIPIDRRTTANSRQRLYCPRKLAVRITSMSRSSSPLVCTTRMATWQEADGESQSSS